MTKFKDKCDECGNFDYLKGIKGKCLCLKCQKEALKSNINNEIVENMQNSSKKQQNELNILDFIEKDSHFSHSIDDIMYL